MRVVLIAKMPDRSHRNHKREISTINDLERVTGANAIIDARASAWHGIRDEVFAYLPGIEMSARLLAAKGSQLITREYARS